jgi:hypothetical protein
MTMPRAARKSSITIGRIGRTAGARGGLLRSRVRGLRRLLLGRVAQISNKTEESGAPYLDSEMWAIARRRDRFPLVRLGYSD